MRYIIKRLLREEIDSSKFEKIIKKLLLRTKWYVECEEIIVDSTPFTVEKIQFSGLLIFVIIKFPTLSDTDINTIGYSYLASLVQNSIINKIEGYIGKRNITLRIIIRNP